MILNYITSVSDILGEALIGILIVFSALTLLVLAFLLSAKINTSRSKKRTEKLGVKSEDADTLDVEKTAAMFLALHLYMKEQRKHDEESNVITIKRIQRRYSPWNSKIYNMNNFQ